MSGNSHYNYITLKELIFIHAYVTGEEIPSSQALQILKQFTPEEIPGTIRQTHRYRIRKNGEELFGSFVDSPLTHIVDFSVLCIRMWLKHPFYLRSVKNDYSESLLIKEKDNTNTFI